MRFPVSGEKALERRRGPVRRAVAIAAGAYFIMRGLPPFDFSLFRRIFRDVFHRLLKSCPSRDCPHLWCIAPVAVNQPWRTRGCDRRRSHAADPTGATPWSSTCVPPTDFSQGHLPSARNVEFAELQAKVGQLVKNKSHPVLLVCQTGQQSAQGGAHRTGCGLRRSPCAAGRPERLAASRYAGSETRSCEVNKVFMYSTQVCPYCQMAERLLKSRGVEHVEKILIDKDPARREEMMTRTGRRTVPQVFIRRRARWRLRPISRRSTARGGLMPLLEAAA